MESFDLKQWLDDHVVPIRGNLNIIAFFWRGTPPDEVLVFLSADPAEDSDELPASWPEEAKRLIDSGFRFDCLREPKTVRIGNDGTVLFGGDGAPLVSQERVASVRLMRRENDGRSLILNIVHKNQSALTATKEVEYFFSLFDTDPFSVLERYGTRFGEA